jgi:hypothetical protein
MIDKKRIAIIHKDLQAVLNKFAADNGLSVSPFNMTYSATGFKFAVQMGDKSELGEDIDPVFAANTKKFGLWFNLSVADLGKEFSFGIDKVKFLGFKNNKTVIYEKNGQKFRTDATRFAEGTGVKKPLVLTQVAAPKV